MEIYRAKEEDRPYVEEKLQKYLLDSTNLELQQFFVAKDNDKVVAFGRVIDHGEFFEIASLGVDYYHRQKGIGKKMLLFLIGEAKRKSPKKPIYVVTHVPEFLKKGGFEEVNICPECLQYKRNNVCKLDNSKIKIMKHRESWVSG